ncbi:MAG: hypothetical protein RLY31_1418 [Bacteroidota bacterium]
MGGSQGFRARVVACVAFLWMSGIGMPVFTQTVIGGSTPDPSAVLDVLSTSKGVLFPRLSTSQRDSIVLPAEGLMIYNLTDHCLEINAGTSQSPFWSSIVCAPGTVTSLDCANAVQTGTLTADSVTSGVSVLVPCTGGDGGDYGGQTVTSTGVTGLTATLAAGSFATGDDSLSYTITGTPDTAGTASFALTIGGQSSTLPLTVACSAPPTHCWAKVSATDTLYFMCHNLASANFCADPFTPSWEIIGGYWQWGRKGPDASQWRNTNTPEFAHGPTGPDAAGANDGAITGRSQTRAPNGAWSDAFMTADDPCPPGYRMPTKAQWDGVLANNTQNHIGPWSTGATNYSSGRFFGSALMLPATGYRDIPDGVLYDLGNYGAYLCSTEYYSFAYNLDIWVDTALIEEVYDRLFGVSVRCAAEPTAPPAGSIGSLDCTNAVQTGTLTAARTP